MSATITPLRTGRSRRHWNANLLNIEAARQAAIAEGDIVRVYDMPGQRDDTYHEGVVERVEPSPGDLVHFHVTRRVWRGEEQQVPVSCLKMGASRGVSMHNGAPCVFLLAKRKVRA